GDDPDGAVPDDRARRHHQLRHCRGDRGNRRLQRGARGQGPLGLRRRPGLAQSAAARRSRLESLQPAGGAPAVPVTDTNEVIARVYREEWAWVVVTLARRLRDLDIAEEMAAEAFATAVERWPVDGVAPNPGAWLATTAYRKAVDRLRREVRREDKHKEALVLSDPPQPLGAIDDDRLRL